VCSYDGDKLNKILADQFKDLHQISTITMGSPEAPYRSSCMGFTFKSVKAVTMRQWNYIFNLDLPRLQFNDADAKAILVMPIVSAAQSGFVYALNYASNEDQTAGTALKENIWYIRDQASQQFYEITQENMLKDCWDASKGVKKDFSSKYYYKVANADIISGFNHKVYVLDSIDPAFPVGGAEASDPLEGKSYLLQARVPLAAVTGNQKHPAGTVVTFDASQNRTEGQVVLNFDITSGTGADFTLLLASGATDNEVPTILKDAPTLLEEFKVYFSKALSAIQLQLAGVSVGQETPNQIPVKPRSFVFWATRLGDFSILSIYLNIDGSTTPDPEGRPSFQYNDGTPGLPIPQGHTGSLILSRDYLTHHYFLQAFQKAGFNQMNPSGDALSPISFTGNFHKATTVQGKRIDVALSFFGVLTHFEYAEFKTVHVDDYQFSFVFKSDDVLQIHSEQVAKVDITINLHYMNPYLGKGFPPPNWEYEITEKKTATVTLKTDKNISLSNAQPSLDGFSLAFSIDKTDYSVTTTSNIEANCDSHTQRDVENKVKEEIGNIAPTLEIRLPELQTLALENMIFNGATRFHLDPGAKMHFPHDLLLLGALKDS
jgi:hypothetical protein